MSFTVSQTASIQGSLYKVDLEDLMWRLRLYQTGCQIFIKFGNLDSLHDVEGISFTRIGSVTVLYVKA